MTNETGNDTCQDSVYLKHRMISTPSSRALLSAVLGLHMTLKIRETLGKNQDVQCYCFRWFSIPRNTCRKAVRPVEVWLQNAETSELPNWYVSDS